MGVSRFAQGTFVLFTLLAAPAAGQSLGTFTWQLQPYCNRVIVSVHQTGAVFTLDGYDNQCDTGERMPLVGVATPNPDGGIGFGLHLTRPTAQGLNIEARIRLPGLSGEWHDGAGNRGVFAFSANDGGALRPTPTESSAPDITTVTAGAGLAGGGTSGDVTVAVDSTLVQRRIIGSCAAGQAVRAIGADGAVTCESVVVGPGNVSAVLAGQGLAGGGTAGEVSLAVDFAVAQRRILGTCAGGQAIRA